MANSYFFYDHWGLKVLLFLFEFLVYVFFFVLFEARSGQNSSFSQIHRGFG